MKTMKSSVFSEISRLESTGRRFDNPQAVTCIFLLYTRMAPSCSSPTPYRVSPSAHLNGVWELNVHMPLSWELQE
jgi:hypothetical protein